MRAFRRSYKVLAKRYKKHFWFNFSFSTNCFWSSGALRIKCFMSVFPLMGGLLKWSKICYIYPISNNDEPWHSYTLPKRIQKYKESCNSFKFCWNQDLFSRTWQFLLYQKTEKNRISSDYFHFYWVFKGCSNQHDSNFNNASKIC